MKDKTRVLLDKAITRESLLASIDAAIHRSHSSNSIFALCEESEPELVVPKGLASPLDIIEAEKEALGVYLSGHPLDFVRKNLFPDCKLEHLKDGQYVGIKGIYRKIKTFTTKKKQEQMAVAWLETRRETAKTLFWPKIWAKLGNLELNKPVWVMGKVILEEQTDLTVNPGFSIEVEDIEVLGLIGR